MEINLNTTTSVSQKRPVKILADIFPKEFIWCYTFISILVKNVLLIGFLLDTNHLATQFGKAINAVFGLYAFRPVYYVGFSLVITCVLFLFKNRSRFIAAIVLNFLVSFLFLVDLWYLRGFNAFPTLHILQAGGNMGDSMSSFFALIHLQDILFILDIPVLILIFFIKRNWCRNVHRNLIFLSLLIIASVPSIIFAAPYLNSIAEKPLPKDAIFNNFNPITTVRSLSPIGYNIYSSYKYFLEKRGLTLSQEDKDKIAEWFEKKNENLPDNEYKGMFKGKNLLIIQVESLEKFVLNQKINDQEITPTLNKLLKNSLFFSKYYEQVGGGNSSDADLMTNASVYPVQLGATFVNYPYTQYNSFPMLMKDIGYYTTAFHPDMGAFWNWMPALKSMGFDKCYDSLNYNITEKISMGISDGSYFDQIEPIIVKQKQPFYTFTVTLSSHTPFEIDDKFKELKLDPDIGNSKLGGYLQCIHYTDKQLGIFLNRLQKDGILDNTVVAIYGDHEGVHKYFPDEIKSMNKKEDWWVDNQKHIPLIIFNKSLSQKEITTAGGQIDILPTLAYLMGVDESKYIKTAIGRNLLKTNKSYAVLRDRTVIGNPDDKDKELAVKGLEFSDEIIRGNYFKK